MGFWCELAARELQWRTAFTVGLDDSQAPNYRWFTDGRLNASFNCLDVHLAERGHKTAIIFEGEPGDVRRLSYQELHAEVCRLANALKAQGIRRGDRVIIYLPLVPEAIVAMQACNRIGAIIQVVFGASLLPALRTASRTPRRSSSSPLTVLARGSCVELAAATDKALASGCECPARSLRRTGKPVAMDARRDLGGTRWCRMRPRRASRVVDPDAVPALHLRLDRQAQGHPARHRRHLLQAKLTAQWVLTCAMRMSSGARRMWAGSPPQLRRHGPLAAGATAAV